MNKNLKSFIFIGLVAAAVFGLPVSAVSAMADIPDPILAIERLILTVTNWLVILSIPVCGMVVVWAKLNHMAADNDPALASTYTRWIKNAIFGLVFIFIARGIIGLLVSILK